MENLYNGIESIRNINNKAYIKILIDVIKKLGIDENANKSCDVSFFKKNNMYEYDKATVLVFNNLKASDIYQCIIEFIANYIVNRYLYEDENSIKNIFAKLYEDKFRIVVVDGMRLTRLSLPSNRSESESEEFSLLNNAEILFIVAMVNTPNYKNYHSAINDVLRSRNMSGKTSVVFFDGTEKEAIDNDYYYISPKVIKLSENNYIEKNYQDNSNETYLEDVLGGK